MNGPLGCRAGDRAVLISGVIAIVGSSVGGAALWLHYLCKPLTTLLILSIVWRQTGNAGQPYRRAVLFGIALSLCGDVFLMLPASLLDSGFLFGLSSFLVAHLFFLRAFTRDAGLFSRPLPLVALLLASGVLLVALWSGIDLDLRIPVLLYMLCLVGMSAQAVSRALQLGTRESRMAACGGVIFLISDSLIACDKFFALIPAAPLAILATYYGALWLIARSIPTSLS